MTELRPTLVKRGATIGANSTILCGLTIGEYAFIGAGAVVTETVSPYALVVGNPAKGIGWMCKCGIKLNLEKEKAVCISCGENYELVDGRIKAKI
jgi:UDP-2-acetamido-3-amino-2,3-dideoxy-glucuronate N-acetyltransferase